MIDPMIDPGLSNYALAVLGFSLKKRFLVFEERAFGFW
jgi:hypothetical protein